MENNLFQIRIALIKAFLNENNYEGILLSRVDDFAMATGGKRNYIYKYSDLGANSLLVDKEGKVYYVGNNVEEPRIFDEELAGLPCERITFLWFDLSPAEAVKKYFHITDESKWVSDDGSLGKNVNDELTILRSLLTEIEFEKYKELGKIAAEAMVSTLREIRQGNTETEVAARLVYEGHKRGCLVPVALIASDERTEKYRHPLPVEKPLLSPGESKRINNIVMVVGCFLKEGLVVSLTRFKQVGKVSDVIKDAYNRICGVDALVQEATVPGKTLGDVFEKYIEAYRVMGFPENEWHNHHQGGATGYTSRTCKGKPGETFPVLDTHYPKLVESILGKEVTFGSAFAWNPSARGVKSEDTFLLYPDGRKEIISSTPELPEVNLEEVLKRPTDIKKSGIYTDV
ncbi:MAG TPA: M24 family metallopeptidase [Candidatus Hydrogenedens sp.]|nr:M24 family metallopeptidase [Candidatus Hydrogenedens sp.]